MAIRSEALAGVERLDASAAVLQRARLVEPFCGIWEAADLQWWWRQARSTDDLTLPVWFDDLGPVAAVGLTAWDRRWQGDVFAVPGVVAVDGLWGALMDAADGHDIETLEVLIRDDDQQLEVLAEASGFKPTEEISGITWLGADERPTGRGVPDGFTIVDRRARLDQPHPMIGRSGEQVEERLRACSLYDPALDLSIEDAEGTVAGYALFWFDPVTSVGLLEPMRVEDAYQRRGLARSMLSFGLERLASHGARRFKVSYVSDAARNLYVGEGFAPTSTVRAFTRTPP